MGSVDGDRLMAISTMDHEKNPCSHQPTIIYQLYPYFCCLYQAELLYDIPVRGSIRGLVSGIAPLQYIPSNHMLSGTVRSRSLTW